MKNLLYIYTSPLDGSTGGSQGLLKEIDGLSQNFNVTKYQIIKKNNKFKTFIRACLFNGGNLDFKDYKKTITYIKRNDFNYVYISSSTMGKLVKLIKKYCKNVKVVVSYQNNEKNYSKDMVKTKGLLYLPLFLCSLYNELCSQKYADFNVFVSDEDRNSMKCKNPSVTIPVTLKDYYEEIEILNNETKPYLLFLGASQFANVEAVKFLINEIAPYVKYKVVIAGSGMDKAFVNKYDNVEIIGYVKNLNELFKNALAFVMPLYYGSGAKVKVAEALMQGKKIIGTPLSLWGYDMDGASYEICNTKDDFIKVINDLVGRMSSF